ncbi:hypothetical protein BJY01DRAFT_215647 [Aspergillus pseudoustus]|uniref:SP-RING-type domain-containing protein n=1 Tax=Aspergillus pseudoustus TaxID=1810923 RepID=A0ABR4JTW1_9EURO
MASLPNETPSSRPPDPPRNNPSSGGVLDLNRSNSTANIFLGGARKSWMATANRPHPSPGKSSNNKTPHCSPATSTPVSLPSSAEPAPPTPSHSACSSGPAPPVTAASSPAPTRSPGMCEIPSLPPQNSINTASPTPPAAFSGTFATTQNVAPSLPQISPTTDTPPSLNHSPAAPHLPSPIRAEQPSKLRRRQQQQQKLTTQLQQSQLQAQSASSLPSPDPTIPPRSHTSPSFAIERNELTIPSLPVAAFPSPPHQQTPLVQPPQPNARFVGGRPAVLPSNQPTGTAHTGPYTPPVHAHPNPPTPNAGNTPLPSQPQVNAVAAVYPSRGYAPAINHGFFVRAKYILDTLGASLSGTHQSLSDTVEAPRIQLLHYACSEQDLMYLILHQVYCLSSYNPSEFRKLPGVTAKHVQGLDTVKHLLVDNSRVSGDFLRWCVQFPTPLPELMQIRGFGHTLSQVLEILIVFVDRWHAFEHRVRSRGYPPLVDDIVSELGIKSPVLQFNIFLCLCRRTPGARLEGKLQEIFIRSLENFKRRYIEQIPVAQQQRENEESISAYRSVIAAMKDFAPAPAGSAVSGVTRPTPTARTPMSPALVHPASASIPTSASHLNTHNRLPPHVFNSQAHLSNGATPASFRSPPVTAPRRLPRQLNIQSLVQNRGPGPQVLSPQMSASPSPAMAVSPSQHMAVRELPQTYQVQQQPPQRPQHQQVRPQNMNTAQPPPHLAQPPAAGSSMTEGHRVPPPNIQYPGPLQKPHPNARPFLPPPNEPPVVNTRPDPRRLAIHQAHLRDPVNRPVSLSPSGEKDTELFPYLTSFAVNPQPFDRVSCTLKWEFSLTGADLSRVPVLRSQGKGQRDIRTLIEGHQSYRIRCIKVPPSASDVKEHSWSVAETVWPCTIYMFVNGKEFYARRKIHNGRDLPLDITAALREGTNHVAIHLVRNPAEQKGLLNYAMGVEVVSFNSFPHAKSLARLLPAAESRKQICGRLSQNTDDEDDDLRIVSDYLNVTLVDPYTALIFTVPVRGRHCQHSECFDHETFLKTRALKPGDCSAIEADWRCPICRQDARPQNLITDGFLLEIRAELERTNRCDGARSLHIKADGSWEVKTDEDTKGGSPQPSHSASKRKSAALESVMHPPSQRPKIDRSPSVPEGSASPAVIVLD